MNGHSALVLPAHLLIKQPLGQPHTPSCPPTHFAFSISSPRPLPLGVSLPPPCSPGHLLPLHGWGGAGLAHCFWQACSTKPALPAVLNCHRKTLIGLHLSILVG